MVNPINNTQLLQEQLIFQYFSGADSIQDRPLTETQISLPYLIEMYLKVNKATITNETLLSLSRLCRYILTEMSGKLKYPDYSVRWKIDYDYATVPAFNATIQTRTGKLIYLPLTDELVYRFVVATIPNSPSFDVYRDSAFVVTDIPVVFTIDSQDFSSWLPTSRFAAQRLLLENFGTASLELADLLDYESFDLTQFNKPNDVVIKYLSDSMELFESLV